MAKIRQKEIGVGRQPGEPSKHQRRVQTRLAKRIAGYQQVEDRTRGGFRKPGSQNLRKHL